MRIEGAAALTLDFGGVTTTTPVARAGRAALRLAVPSGGLRGPDKYKVLEQRRRRAQIAARRLLDLIEEAN
ncbi:MAG TPA: hypothetical protein VM364_06480 [Vicinamibacterales bacterium]|nr:hypothetical protein [Vicinamibacterales bacterium]